jgi:DNA repair protein RadC
MRLQETDLFGGPTSPQTHRIVLKRIEARFKTEVVREDAPLWVTTRYTRPEQVFEMFKELRDEAKEHFISLHLDGKNRIVWFDRVSVGSLNQSIVNIRELMKTACVASAAAILMIHNHPSGDPTPSREDIDITRRAKEAGELLGIKVLDHVIIGDNYLSFVEQGLL